MTEKRYTTVRGQKKCPYYEVISKKCLLAEEQEKYTIVRVDNWDKCPSELNEIKKDFICELSCEECRYGDTKEQLIKKVAQIRFKQETQYSSKDMLKVTYNKCYRQAKEIVEFLGVK